MAQHLYLVTSNIQKLEEYRRYGLPFEVREGQDLKEVIADSDTVAMYKARDAGPGAMVDDTILTFNGKELVDVRWRVRELVEQAQATAPEIRWIVTLAHHAGDHIQLFRGVVECELITDIDFDNVPADAFAFDPFLSPKGLNTSFYQLKAEGRKDAFSPRYRAVQAYLTQQAYKSVPVHRLPAWTGEYQSS